MAIKKGFFFTFFVITALSLVVTFSHVEFVVIVEPFIGLIILILGGVVSFSLRIISVQPS